MAPWLRGSVSRYIARFHARSARVYTPSEPAREDLNVLGVHDVKVRGRGVDIAAFHPSRRSQMLRAAYGVDNSIVLLHVGRLAAEKGVDKIVKAFLLARHSLPAGSIRLLIAGAGPEEKSLRELAGPDVLVLVVLEAMAAGLPVIATPAGGVADHLRDDENGIAVPPYDVERMASAILALAMDTDRRKRLSIGARQTAERLDWEAELDRLDESYRKVLAYRANSGENGEHTAHAKDIFDTHAAARAAS